MKESERERRLFLLFSSARYLSCCGWTVAVAFALTASSLSHLYGWNKKQLKLNVEWMNEWPVSLRPTAIDRQQQLGSYKTITSKLRWSPPSRVTSQLRLEPLLLLSHSMALALQQLCDEFRQQIVCSINILSKLMRSLSCLSSLWYTCLIAV